MNHDSTIDLPSRRALLALARESIAAGAAADYTRDAVELVSAPFSIFEERRGAFVTLTRRARLRGCIGRVEPDQPLGAMIPDVARLAAFCDPRFAPVEPADVALLVIEISILSQPVPLADPGHVVVGRHGLRIASRGRRGLLLPQVAVEYDWTHEEFLEQVCVKAGLARGAWREGSTRLETFTAEVFSERDVTV